MSKEDRFKEIFQDDPFNLLNLEREKKGPNKDKDSSLIESFKKISDFYEENGELPDSENGVEEHILSSRLDRIKSNPQKVKILLPYDYYGLLESGRTRSIPLEEIIKDDPLGLLEIDEEGNELFKLKHVKKTDRIRPDFIARRKKCENFEDYEEKFIRLHRDLRVGNRKLIEFNERDVDEGKYFVLRGVVLYIEKSVADVKTYSFCSGPRNRLDGRIRCIFDNGTESMMLLRSLNKALRLDGFGISDVIEKKPTETKIECGDIQNGYIYVIKSKSEKPEINGVADLFKVGYSQVDVTHRIRNAPKEPTYLMAEVQIVTLFRCFNLHVKDLESKIHTFFRDVNVEFEIRDNNGKLHKPREWFTAPLNVIEEAIQLIVDGEIDRYKYNTQIKKIILKKEADEVVIEE